MIAITGEVMELSESKVEELRVRWEGNEANRLNRGEKI